MSFVGYMETLLGEPNWNSSGVEAHWNCPFCVERGETVDTRERFRFNSEKLRGYCFNCEWGGNAVTFIRDYQKLNWSEAFDIVSFYADYTPLPESVYDEVFDKLYLEGRTIESVKRYIKPPDDFKLLAGSKSLQAERFIKYAKSRGLTEKQIELHGCGFCPVGEFEVAPGKTTNLSNRLFIQAFDEKSKPIYWMGRSLDPKAIPKTFNPTGGNGNIGKTDILFNLNNARKTGVAVITEGVFDATTVGDSGIALFGKGLNAKQLTQIVGAEFERVYVMLDPDAFKNALKISETLSRHIPNLYLCNLKDGDPNEVGKRGCLDALRTAEKYNRLTTVKYKL